MLTPYRRHNPAICRFTKRSQKNCLCPVWVAGSLNGNKIPRQSLDTRNWTEAERKIAFWMAGPDAHDRAVEEQKREVKREKSTPNVTDAVEQYLGSCKSERNVVPSTLVSYRTTLYLWCDYLTKEGITQLCDMEVPHTRGFIATREQFTPRTRKKELEHLRFFFNWCIENSWIALSPARKVKIKLPKEKLTLPLEDEEIELLLAACDQLTNPVKRKQARARLRAKALVLSLCYTGLRISDICTLRRAEVRQDGYSKTHVMIKTKKLAFTRFGERALRALLAVPVEGPYFFWSGKGQLSAATASARRTLTRLGELTKVAVRPHRFRDTFAKKTLEETGDIRVLQYLLGHQSLRTTEEHYEHLGPQHEARLDDALTKVARAFDRLRDGTTGQVIEMPHRD